MHQFAFLCVVLGFLLVHTTGQATDPPCPEGKPIVNCFVAPCSNERPTNCPSTARCVDDYCGGCNRRYYDENGVEICNECEDISLCGPAPGAPTIQCSDGSTGGSTGRCIRTRDGGCGWEFRECPRNCSQAMCRMYCQYGFQQDSDGCFICACNPAPDCRTIACAQVQCPYDATHILPGDCCPSCINPCQYVRCPQVDSCSPGYQLVRAPGSCCASCEPIPDCTTAALPENCARTRPTCPAGTSPVLRGCCYLCEPADCSTVLCAQVACGPNEKPVYEDGSCCPTCQPIPDCSNVRCASPTCPAGSQLTAEDLSCCGTCTPPDGCETVRCMQPGNCPAYAYIYRQGSCCPQCPLCKDSQNEVCNTNDDKECRGGFWRGDACAEPIPDDQRHSTTFYVKFCGKNCEQLDAQTVRLYAASRSNIPAKYITVNIEETSDDGCCTRYEIIIAAEAGTFDVHGAQTQVSNALGTDPTFTVEQSNSDSTLVKASFMLLGVILLFV